MKKNTLLFVAGTKNAYNTKQNNYLCLDEIFEVLCRRTSANIILSLISH